MDGSSFDGWSRRRVGVAAGGLAAALLSLAGMGEAAAKKKKKKKKKKKCCLAVRATCSSDSQCCEGSVCGQRAGIENITVCCVPDGQPCTNTPGSQLECCGNSECSPDLVCAPVP